MGVDLLFKRDVVTNTTVLAGDTNSLGVVWCLWLRVEWGTTLRLSIVVVILGYCQLLSREYANSRAPTW